VSKLGQAIINAAKVATQLGFDPQIGFVTVERGRIGFSIGKPEEIRALAARATAAGYKITAALRLAAKEVR
jgi:hypothetical protein